jgi:serine protease Do
MRREIAAGLAALFVPALAHADLAHRHDAVVDVVQKASPAVVFIGTKQVVRSNFRSMDPFFDQFFAPEDREVESLGSGVIVDPSGTIVTNDHVIHGASEIHVTLADGRSLDAEVIGADETNDLAVLKVKPGSPLPAAKLGTSSDLMIGETVVAIGSPFGLSKTVTAGVVSATGRSFRVEDRTYNDFIQTDASINPGNSGGPLLNVDGDVVGINTAIYAEGRGIGFAIPADKVKRIVAELTQFGKVRPAWVGVFVQHLTPELAASFGWDKNYGVVVTSVEPGSPGEKAGVKQGDLIATAGGSAVADDDDFDAKMRGYPAKSKVDLEVWREGKLVPLSLTTVEFPAAKASSLGWDRLGLKVQPGRGALAVAQVRPGSPAARAGLEPGDWVLRVNNQPLTSPDEFRDALVAARTSRSVLLLVQRGRVVANLSLPFQKG